MISYDSDRAPEGSGQLLELAKVLGQQLVNVICDEPGARVGDAGGVSFLAITPGVPSKGDRIELQDGRRCEVVRVLYKVTSIGGMQGKPEAFALVPNVLAILVEEPDHGSSDD